MDNHLISFNLPQDKSSIIKVIGVGGGGGNAINHMYQQGITDVDFVICNTDLQALNNSPVPVKIQLGKSLTQGLGAGNTPDKGCEAAKESQTDIENILANNTKMVFITAGMGGGTGTGAAPVIAEIAKKQGILTVGIVTLPFHFEGMKRMTQATEGLKNMKEHVDALLVISNEKIREIHGDLKISEAFQKADNVLTVAAKGIAEIITVPGIRNVDFADVKTVMENSGVALMGSSTASGENRAIDAVEAALTSPLLNNNNIKGAKNILLQILSSQEHEVKMDEISIITEYIQQITGMTADVIWGDSIDDSLGENLSITVIATGFDDDSVPELALEEIKKTRSIPLNEEDNTELNDSIEENTPPTKQTFAITDSDMVNEDDLIEDVTNEIPQPTQPKNANVNTTPRPSVYTKEYIEEVEKEPAYKRRNVDLHATQQSLFTNDELTNNTVTNEDGQTKIKKGNSFLSNNPD